jgi:hypothetical protein
MTYGRDRFATHKHALRGAVVSHSAELVRGDSLAKKKGPLIRPSGTISPRGEGFSRTLRETQDRTSARKTHAKTSLSAVA